MCHSGEGSGAWGRRGEGWFWGPSPGFSCRGGSELRFGPLSSLRALAGGGGDVASASEKASCTLHRGTPVGMGAWSRDKPALRGPGGAAEQQVGRRRQAVLSTSHCQVHLKLTGPQNQSSPGSEAVGLALESSWSENGWACLYCSCQCLSPGIQL